MSTYRLDWTAADNGTGWLCIVYTDNSWSEPVRISQWWPCFTCTKRDSQYVYEAPRKAADTGVSDGIYNIPPLHAGEAWKTMHLKDGGRTMPIRTDSEAIPKPRTRVPVKYERGCWWKNLKREGWVRA